MAYTSNVYNSVWRYKKPTFGLGYYYNAKAGDGENNRIYINFNNSNNGYLINTKSKWVLDFLTNNELGKQIRSQMISNYKNNNTRGNSVSFAYLKDNKGLYLAGSGLNLGDTTYIDRNNKETGKLNSIYQKNRLIQSYNDNYVNYRNKRNSMTNNQKFHFDSNGRLTVDNANLMARNTGNTPSSNVTNTSNDFIKDIIGNNSFDKITGNRMYDAIRYLLDKDKIYNINRRLNYDDTVNILEKINEVLKQNGMRGLVVDGVLGPSTYHMMKTLLKAGYNF